MNPGIFQGIGQVQQNLAAPTPIGGFLALPANGSANPTIDGAEYLKTSVLKPVAGYESLVANNPYLGVVLGTVGQVAGSQLNALAGTSNGRIYALSPNEITTATSVSGSFSTVLSGTGVTDFCVIGTRLVATSGNTTILSILGATNTNRTGGANLGRCAANTAGTLCVVAAATNLGAPDSISTSTDGSTFTIRTPSLQVNECRLVMWCPVASTFLFLNSQGQLWSSTDGFTLTARTALPSVTDVGLPVGIPANTWASSATSTAFIANLTVGGIIGRYLCRTTNGTSFNITRLSDLLNLDSYQIAPPDKIAQVGSEWIMWSSHSSRGGLATVYKSSDDGVTWSKSPLWFNPSEPAVADFVLGQGTGPTTTFIAGSGSSSSRLVSVPQPTTATHVGLTIPAYDGRDLVGNVYSPLYLRIK